LFHVVDGKPSKQIAEQFGISQRTVEQHRSHIMHKLEVESLAELVRFSVESRENSPTAQVRDTLKLQSPPLIASREGAVR
jgi:hypothetical protein